MTGEKECRPEANRTAGKQNSFRGHEHPQDSTPAPKSQPDSCTSNRDAELATLEMLIAAGAQFTTPPRGQKSPGYPGWQRTPKPVREVMAHARNEGNVGLLGGSISRGIVPVDADKFYRMFRARFAAIHDPIRVERDDEPDRGKVLVQFTDRVPLSCAWIPQGETKPALELFSDTREGTAKQAIIFGTHPSGAPYRLRGSQLIEMPYAKFADIWRAHTGEPFDEPESERQHAPKTPQERPGAAQRANTPDNLRDAVLNAWTPLEVFRHFGWVTKGTRAVTGGETQINGRGGLFVTDDGEWYHYSAGKGGNALAAWHYCRTNGQSTHWTYAELREMAEEAGIAIPDIRHGASAPESDAGPGALLPAILLECRKHILSPALAETLRGAGIRLVANYLRTLDALIDVAEAHNRLCFAPGIREIAALAGCSAQTVINHLTKFAELGIVALRQLDPYPYVRNSTGEIVTGYRLEIDLSVWAAGIYSSFLDSKLHPEVTLSNFDEKIQTPAFFRRHKADDAFRTLRYGNPDAEKSGPYERAIVRRFNRTKQMTVLADSLGGSCLSLWQILLDGPGTVVELCERTGLSRATVDRALQKMARAGFVTVASNRTGARGRPVSVYALRDDAEHRLGALRPEMASYGVSLRQQIGYTKERLGRAEWQADHGAESWQRDRAGRRAEILRDKLVRLWEVADSAGIESTVPIGGRRWRMPNKVDYAEALDAWRELDGVDVPTRRWRMAQAGWNDAEINAAQQADAKRAHSWRKQVMPGTPAQEVAA